MKSDAPIVNRADYSGVTEIEVKPIVNRADYSGPKTIEVRPYVRKIDWNNITLDMGETL